LRIHFLLSQSELKTQLALWRLHHVERTIDAQREVATGEAAKLQGTQAEEEEAGEALKEANQQHKLAKQAMGKQQQALAK